MDGKGTDKVDIRAASPRTTVSCLLPSTWNLRAGAPVVGYPSYPKTYCFSWHCRHIKNKRATSAPQEDRETWR